MQFVLTDFEILIGNKLKADKIIFKFPFVLFQVFCRIRPLNDNEEDICVEVVTNNTIQLNPPQVVHEHSQKF